MSVQRGEGSEKLTPEQKAANYIEEICGITSLHNAIALLIESHRRQFSIISEEMNALMRFHRRFRFLPLWLRRWLRGDV